MSEVRGRSREDPMPEGQGPRGITPRPRSGAAAERRYPTHPRQRPGAAAARSYPTPPHRRPGAEARRNNPRPEARGCGREDQPHVQGAVVAQAQEGLEELSHVEGQEWLW